MATSFKMISVFENKRRIKDPSRPHSNPPSSNLAADRHPICSRIGNPAFPERFEKPRANPGPAFWYSLNPNWRIYVFGPNHLVSGLRSWLSPVTRKLRNPDYRRSVIFLENPQRFDFFEIPHRSAVIIFHMSLKSIVTSPCQFAQCGLFSVSGRFWTNKMVLSPGLLVRLVLRCTSEIIGECKINCINIPFLTSNVTMVSVNKSLYPV